MKDLRRAGFGLLPGRGKGSHLRYRHPKRGVPDVTLKGKLNADALPYSEAQVRAAIQAAKDAP